MAIPCDVGLNDDACENPPNVEEEYQTSVTTKCYRCGRPACRACSWLDLDPMVGRRTRRCRDCRTQEGEFPWLSEEDR